MAYGFDDSRTFKQLWKYDNKKGYAEAHQIRVADVDYDGRDEVMHMGYAINPDGSLRYTVDNVVHGDRWYVGAFSNDNNNHEMYGYGIQQNNPNGLLEYFYNASTGKLIWEHYAASGTYDVARGNVGDIDPNYDGFECWSFQGLYSMDNQKISDNTLYPVIRLWWDGDLLSESYNDGKIEKWDYNNKSVGRVLTTWKVTDSTGSDRGAPMFYGDIMGDWREEVVMTSSDYSALVILTTTIPTDYRIYSLAQNPAYRNCMTAKGYYQSHMADFFLGYNMETPDMPNISIIGEPDSNSAESIAFAEKSVTVRENDTYLLKAIISPEDASNQRLIWTSDNVNAAKVTNGLITGVGPGTATVTATTRDGSLSASCQVTVVRVNAESVRLSADSISIKEGGSYRLTATVYPEDATRKAVSWISSNKSVATVDKGQITGISTGTCTVTVTTEDGGCYAICRVTVLPVDDIDVLDSGVFEGADGKSTSASLDIVNSPNGAEFYRDFIPFYEDTATLSFTFNTGGQKSSNDAWNWDGREYTFGLDFLDTFGSSILNISQAYRSGAQATMGAVNGESAEEIKSGWTGSGNVDVGGTNHMNRSTTTWVVTLEFNYDDDICTATIENSLRDTAYTKTFYLEGKSFGRLRYYATVDGSGPITVKPSLSNLSYTISTADKGASMDIMSVNVNSAKVRLINSTRLAGATLVGELYDGDGKLVETKELSADLPSVQEIDFDSRIDDYELKLSLWDEDTLLASSTISAASRPDIALVTATDEPEPEDNPIKNAYDGRLDTVWTSFGMQNIIFEMEEESLFTGARVAFMKYNDDRTIPFRIYSSTDKMNWQQVYSGISVPGSDGFIDCEITPVTAARYVKVEVDGNSVSGWTSLAEVELYTSRILEDVEEEQRPTALTIVNATATAEPQSENSIKNAYDGNLDTVWASEKTQSITFDLGKEYRITDVSVAFKKYDDDRTIPFRVYISDGKAETKVYEGSSTPFSGGFNDIEISSGQNGRYVRVEVDGNTVSHWTSLAEVLIYGFEIKDDLEEPAEPSVKLTGVRGATVEAELNGEGTALLIGALYSSEGVLEEVKSVETINLPCAAEITFAKDIVGYEIKLFMWESKEELVPLAPVFEAEIVKLDIASAIASAEPEPQNSAKNSYDGDLSTFWSAQHEQNIVYDLGDECTLAAVKVSFREYEDDRTIPFKLSVSADNNSWTEIYSGSSIPQSGDFMSFSASGKTARYVKIDVSGNTVSRWTSLTEVEIYGVK